MHCHIDQMVEDVDKNCEKKEDYGKKIVAKIDLTLASLLAALSSALSLWCSPRTLEDNFEFVVGDIDVGL